MDKKELCRRFILDDRLITVNKQKSPFTGTKVIKNTKAYRDTLRDCKEFIEVEDIKRTKKDRFTYEMEAILPLISKELTSQQRKTFLSSISSVGTGRKTKDILESERDRELLSLSDFKPYETVKNSSGRIDFYSIPESFVIPENAYGIFLKYFKKGVPIPKQIEDFFDNPPDPKFYQKLVRIATQEKIKISEYLFNMIFSKIKFQSVIDYYQKVLKKPISEAFLKNNKGITNPKAILMFQPIKSNSIFLELLTLNKNIDSKLLDFLIERYSERDNDKLAILYYFISDSDKFQKQKKKLEDKISSDSKHVEKIIDLLHKDDISIDKKYENFVSLYLKLFLKHGPSEKSEENLSYIIKMISNNDLKKDIFLIWKSIFPERIKTMKDEDIYGDYLADVYGNGEFSKFDFLKFILDEIGEDKKLLRRFLFSLDQYYNLNKNDLIDIIGSHKNELNKVANKEFYPIL